MVYAQVNSVYVVYSQKLSLTAGTLATLVLCLLGLEGQ